MLKIVDDACDHETKSQRIIGVLSSVQRPYDFVRALRKCEDGARMFSSETIAKDLVIILWGMKEEQMTIGVLSRAIYPVRHWKFKTNPSYQYLWMITNLLEKNMNEHEVVSSRSAVRLVRAVIKMSSDSPIVLKYVKCVSSVIQTNNRDHWICRGIAASLNSLQRLKSSEEEVRELVRALAKKAASTNQTMTSKQVSASLSGLKYMSSEYEEVRDLVRVITAQVSASEEPFTAQDVSMSMYGVQNMSTDHVEVRELLCALKGRIRACTEPFIAEDVRKVMQGVRVFRCHDEETFELLDVLTTKISTCTDDLEARDVGNLLFTQSLRNISSEHAQVRNLLSVLASKFATVSEVCPAVQVAKAVNGLSKMSSEHEEVRYLLRVLGEKAAQCTEPFTTQHINSILYGLKAMNYEHDEVRAILRITLGEIAEGLTSLSASELRRSLNNLQHQSSDDEEVDVKKVLRSLARRCRRVASLNDF
jgi:hemerythrin-like domain-containing protein